MGSTIFFRTKKNLLKNLWVNKILGSKIFEPIFLRPKYLFWPRNFGLISYSCSIVQKYRKLIHRISFFYWHEHSKCANLHCLCIAQRLRRQWASTPYSLYWYFVLLSDVLMTIQKFENIFKFISKCACQRKPPIDILLYSTSKATQ